MEMTIDNFFEQAKQHVRSNVPRVHEDIVSSKDKLEWAEELFAKFSLPLIEELKNPTGTFVTREEQVQDYGRHVLVEFVYFEIEWEFKISPKVEFSINLRPNPNNPMLPMTDWNGQRLRFEIKIGPASQVDQAHVQEAAQSKIDGTVEAFRVQFAHKNQNINNGNRDLKLVIEEAIEQRKKAVSKKQEALQKLSQRIAIPLKKHNESIRPVKLQTTEPIAKQITQSKLDHPASTTKEYVLKREDFLRLVEYVNRYLRSCERTPIPFNTLEEEHIRDLMLPYLNQVFEGATGETFSKQGKTDIYLVIEEGCILICECKWWNGAKSMEEVIEQVLKRVTWRENYGIVMVFVKGNASTIIEKAKEVIVNHPSNSDKKVELMTTGHLYSKNLRKDDASSHVEIHYLFYNFPPKS